MNKKVIITSIITLFLLILLIVTCPSKQDHKDVIVATLTNVIDDELYESVNEDEQEWAMIGSLFTGKIIEVFLDQRLKVNNYLLFSTGITRFQGTTKRVSFGILNHVFTFDEDELKEAIHEDEE